MTFVTFVLKAFWGSEFQIGADHMLHIETDMHDVAISHDVLLPLDLELARVLHGTLRSVLDEHLVRNYLSPDESTLEIRVNPSGRHARVRSTPDRPGAYLVFADGEERDQVEEPVRCPDEPRQRRLRDAKVIEKCFLLVRRKPGDLRFDAR